VVLGGDFDESTTHWLHFNLLCLIHKDFMYPRCSRNDLVQSDLKSADIVAHFFDLFTNILEARVGLTNVLNVPFDLTELIDSSSDFLIGDLAGP